MKLQKLKKLLAFSMAVTMVTPTTAFASAETVEVVQDESLEEGGSSDTEVVKPTEPEKPVVPTEPTEPDKPVVPEKPVVPTEPTEPDKPVVPTEPEKPVVPDKPVVPEKPVVPTEPTKPTEPVKPVAPTEATKPVTPNKVKPPIKMPEIKVQKDFRFWNISKEYAFANKELNILEYMKDDSRVLGTMQKDGLMFVIKSCNKDWAYVESGTVRGFVKVTDIIVGDNAIKKVNELQDNLKKETEKENEKIKSDIEKEVRKEKEKSLKKNKKGIVIQNSQDNVSIEEEVNKRYEESKKEVPSFETVCTFAKELISWRDNKSLDYTRTTTQNILINKDFGIVNAYALNVREGKGVDSRIVGLLPHNALVYVVADKDDDWVYIESANVRGFVSKKYVDFGEQVNKEVAEKGEESFPVAKEVVPYEKNKALRYTMTSIKSGYHSTEKREEIVKYASQFIGNPYVWGGTDLVNGADCSGFVQSVYKKFGYNLPRVSREQAKVGTKIKVEDALPGDLIFYADSTGRIYHVVMYAGEGVTVEAKSEHYGITNGKVSGNACWAVRILEDEGVASGEEVVRVAESGSYGKYLGNFKLTYYCPNSCCCGEYANGKTATGTTPTQGRTIAVDPKVIPYGTEVIIGNRVYVAEDCGGAIKGNRIDIFMNSHEDATNMGVGYADVYIKK